MAAELDVRVAHDNDDRLILVGELDTHTAPMLAEHLAGLPDATDIVLDLSATTFISSAGLSTILRAQRRLEAGGGSLIVSDPDPTVARTIELSGLAETLGIS
jgi:anti-anti-sigma factor